MAKYELPPLPSEATPPGPVFFETGPPSATVRDLERRVAQLEYRLFQFEQVFQMAKIVVPQAVYQSSSFGLVTCHGHGGGPDDRIVRHKPSWPPT